MTIIVEDLVLPEVRRGLTQSVEVTFLNDATIYVPYISKQGVVRFVENHSDAIKDVRIVPYSRDDI